MANVVTGNPWSLDTAATITTGMVKLNKLVWHEPTTAGHTVNITDKDGQTIWHKYALAPGSGMDYEIDFDGEWFEGFILETISSGTLYVFVA